MIAEIRSSKTVNKGPVAITNPSSIIDLRSSALLRDSGLGHPPVIFDELMRAFAETAVFCFGLSRRPGLADEKGYGLGGARGNFTCVLAVRALGRSEGIEATGWDNPLTAG